MKVTELIIGDWVKLMNPKGECIDYVKIDANLFGIFLRDGEEGFVRFEPLPLTPEIMEKNGWKWRTRYDIESLKLLSEDGHCLMSLTYGKKISVGGHEIEIKYVHELQHALRLCGLDGLADNFQI